jgi:hypothetical protein
MPRYSKWAISIFLFAGLLWFILPNLPTQFAAVKDWKKFSTKSKKASEARRKLIDQELGTLKEHPWAGRYYYGDGLGVNVALSLAPKSGFVFTWNGCLGLYDLNYGEVAEADGRLRLVFTFPNEREGFQGIAPELLPIVWGERHYLIPADEVVHFANAINAGFEPRHTVHGRFLLRAGDELKHAQGVPNIPSEFSAYLLRKPIKAEISSIKDSRTEDSKRITTAVLNAGTAQGVKQGMEFWVYVPSAIYGLARITRVDRSYSEVTIDQYEADGKSHVPSPGWKLSTHVRQD